MSLSEEFQDVTMRRQVVWSALLERWSKFENDGTDFYFDEVPMDFDQIPFKTASGFSNRVDRKDLTKQKIQVICRIEDELKSNLKELILKREKCTLYCDINAYPIAHQATKKEIKRLLGANVSPEDMNIYVKLCVAPKAPIQHFIEEDIKSKLRLFITEAWVEENVDNYIFWSSIVQNEMEFLRKIIPEEDVIIYAVNVAKENGF